MPIVKSALSFETSSLLNFHKVLRDKAFKTAYSPEYDRHQRELATMVHKFFDKKSKGSGIKFMPNQQLPNELNKSNIRKF